MDPVSPLFVALKSHTSSHFLDASTDVQAPLGAFKMLGDPETLLAEYDAVDEKPEVAELHPDGPADGSEQDPIANDCTESVNG